MPIGGVTRRAAVIRKEREKATHMLVLDAGDSLLNNQQPAKGTRGKTSIEAMNKMGYDAMALGMLDLSLLSLDGRGAFPHVIGQCLYHRHKGAGCQTLRRYPDG